jgi:hypothetical protein
LVHWAYAKPVSILSVRSKAEANLAKQAQNPVNGIAIPDSRLCREITELVRDVESELLFNHSSRVFYFGALTGKRCELRVDHELLYAARDFLSARGISPADIELVWMAVALHTTPGIPVHMHPIVALVSAGVRLDVVGVGYDELPEAHREAVVAAYPRPPQFAEDIIQAFFDGMKHKPETAYGTINADVLAEKDPHYVRGNYCSAIRGSRWTK